MPSATPLPARPSRLALFGAGDLLRPDGCPVCRYAAEAGDRFLGWFALEAHADADMITRLCGSLGFCAVHTRGMLVQPGAAVRMTALYTYLLRAAARNLADGTSPSGRCLPCARDAEASDRALETLLTGLQETDLRERYRDSHGLCLPHLRAAVPRAGHRLAAWLARDMLSRLAAGPPGLALLTGHSDPDADVRARLRASLPGAALPADPGPAAPPTAREGEICEACRMACVLERDAVGQWAAAARAGSEPSPSLCPAHLRDACAEPAAGRLLALETERAEAWLASLTSTAGPSRAFRRLAVRRHRTQGGEGQGDCPACRASDTTAWGAKARQTAGMRGQPPVLCVRHVLALGRRDPRGAAPFARAAARSTETVLGELEQAFRKQAWAHRDELRGREMTAWRRAAALIDGRVYGGGPPVPLSQFHDPHAWQAYWLLGQQPKA
jgi:hypothetical protein